MPKDTYSSQTMSIPCAFLSILSYLLKTAISDLPAMSSV